MIYHLCKGVPILGLFLKKVPTCLKLVQIKSNWQICKPVKLRARGEELHWQAYLSVAFARHSWLQVFVSWWCNVIHSTWLEGSPPAEDWIICAGQLNRNITTNNVDWSNCTSHCTVTLVLNAYTVSIKEAFGQNNVGKGIPMRGLELVMWSEGQWEALEEKAHSLN